MPIQKLKYIVEIERTGSINKAAQNLFVSQSTLSRALKEMEEKTNIIIFRRSAKGVVLTYEGMEFLKKVHPLLDEYDRIKSTFFLPEETKAITLKIATQRYSHAIQALLHFYDAFCANAEYVNIALYEDTTENIIRLISDQIYNIGIIHITSDNEDYWLDSLKRCGIVWELVEDSRVYVQINQRHPLASQETIKTDELSPYPHVTFSDEDITSINYCSDIRQYNHQVLKKRIIVQDRGTLQQVISHTDAYYLGTDLTLARAARPENSVFIPLKDTDIQIKTWWIRLANQELTQYEEAFLTFLKQQTRINADSLL